MYVKWGLYLLAFLAVGFPIWVWQANALLSWGEMALFEIFPLFGLIAFSVMWLHIIGGMFRTKLEKIINWQRFVDISSMVVLISIILHPGLMLVAFIASGSGSPFDYASHGSTYLIWSATTAWIIFVTYDWLKDKKGRDMISKHWLKIKFISTLGFFLVLYHSLGVGSDLQSGALQKVWWFYGLTAFVATIYSYIYLPNKSTFKNNSRDIV